MTIVKGHMSIFESPSGSEGVPHTQTESFPVPLGRLFCELPPCGLRFLIHRPPPPQFDAGGLSSIMVGLFDLQTGRRDSPLRLPMQL
jgi:hypothetical protein